MERAAKVMSPPGTSQAAKKKERQSRRGSTKPSDPVFSTPTKPSDSVFSTPTKTVPMRPAAGSISGRQDAPILPREVAMPLTPRRRRVTFVDLPQVIFAGPTDPVRLIAQVPIDNHFAGLPGVEMLMDDERFDMVMGTILSHLEMEMRYDNSH